MDLGLRNARVLVTGGASNIGRGIVHGFADEGARVLICDLDADQAVRVRDEALERKAAAAEVFAADLAAPGAGERAVGRVLELWGGIDVLVANAGISIPSFIADHTDRSQWQRMFEVNLFAAIECVQAAVPPMRQSGAGAVVTIASDAAFGEIRQGVYGASKAALVALTRTVAREHGRHGIRANAVCPGLVIPEGPEAVGAASLWAGGQDAIFNEGQVGHLLKATPLRRLSTAGDVAASVL
ncbi:SDR family NAD(P)-dependent oxidoreductase, partial [Streptomyces sp. NPDC055078]